MTPPEGRPSQIHHRSPVTSPRAQGLSSPPNETQALSQFVFPPSDLSHEVTDEEAEGVWGYLIPLNSRCGEPLVLRNRAMCPATPGTTGPGKGKRQPRQSKGNISTPCKEVESFETDGAGGLPTGGYLVGRHPECGTV